MKITLQLVTHASVSVAGEVTGAIDHGLLLLAGFAEGDQRSCLKPMAEKIAHLRIFPDERGRFHFSLLDVQGAALVIPQFTLFADMAKGGRRPEFTKAMRPPEAEDFFLSFVETLRSCGIPKVEKGVFGAHMDVALLNSGPVTINLEM